jgi:16S rRNA (guanine(966)-N(2))-methyltransferase RsmD
VPRIIGGSGKGRRLKAPAGDATRPTGARVRQTLFDILAAVVPGGRFLDAFAGGGGVGLEALSRGARRVVLVDESRAAVEAVRANLALMAPAPNAVEVLQRDARAALRALRDRGERFDVIYLDPPYDSDLYEPILPLADEVLDEGGVIVAEHFHKRALPERMGRLVKTRSVRVGDHLLTFYRRNVQEPD